MALTPNPGNDFYETLARVTNRGHELQGSCVHDREEDEAEERAEKEGPKLKRQAHSKTRE